MGWIFRFVIQISVMKSSFAKYELIYEIFGQDGLGIYLLYTPSDRTFPSLINFVSCKGEIKLKVHLSAVRRTRLVLRLGFSFRNLYRNFVSISGYDTERFLYFDRQSDRCPADFLCGKDTILRRARYFRFAILFTNRKRRIF